MQYLRNILIKFVYISWTKYWWLTQNKNLNLTPNKIGKKAFLIRKNHDNLELEIEWSRLFLALQKGHAVLNFRRWATEWYRIRIRTAFKNHIWNSRAASSIRLLQLLLSFHKITHCIILIFEYFHGIKKNH